MDKLTNFKEFVKKNPSFVKYVKNNEMTWQKFYELYDLYGEDDSVWATYRNIEANETIEKTVTAAAGATGLSEIFDWLKNINLDTFQDGINSVQRVISVLQDLGNKDTNIKPEYTPRPLYKHFED